jgi:serine/threonine-protein phosphatase 2B catalytic subunit
MTYRYSRKSDIENERLPPDLVDPEEALQYLSNSATPSEPEHPQHYASPLHGLEEALAANSIPATPGTPTSPISGSPASGERFVGGFRRGHARQSSLGTTMTSPSNRRRSIESTISLIREAVDGRGDGNAEVEAIAESISSPVRTSGPRFTPTHSPRASA